LQDGQPVRVRLDFAKTEDGSKAVLWEPNKAKVWMKDKNILAIVGEQSKDLMNLIFMMDPKSVFERMTQKVAAKTLVVETIEPSKQGEPIILKVTEPSAPDRYDLLYINPQTKLIDHVEKYSIKAGAPEMTMRWDYLDPKQAYAARFDAWAGERCVGA
jgi:hypothetical protein